MSWEGGRYKECEHSSLCPKRQIEPAHVKVSACSMHPIDSHIYFFTSELEACRLGSRTVGDCEGKCCLLRNPCTSTVGGCDDKCSAHHTPCKTIGGGCEGKFHGHRTPCSVTVGFCGRKNPSAQSCPSKSRCHPKKSKDIFSPATSRR